MANLAFAKTPFYQIYYTNNKQISDTEKLRLQNLYGAHLIFIADAESPPSTPIKVSGTVLHSDPSDALWVIGDKNPLLENLDLVKSFSDDRLIEEAFLLKHFPRLAPKSHGLSDFFIGLPVNLKAQHRLMLLRDRLTAKFQNGAIIKPRSGFGSEGRLPSTHQNWAQVYSDYIKSGKKEFQLLRDSGLPDIELQSQIAQLKHIEGHYLEKLLTVPDEFLVQELISPYEFELRMHIVPKKQADGSLKPIILKNATINRYDQRGNYVPNSVILAAEVEIQNELIDKLPANLQSTYAAALDVVKSGDRFYIVDQNFGMQSGMFYAENDIMIANLIAEHFSESETPFLKSFRRFAKAPLNEKPRLAKLLIASYGAFVDKHQASGFWERIVQEYIKELSQNPSIQNTKLIEQAFLESNIKPRWAIREFYSRLSDSMDYQCTELLLVKAP
jgi:hypothetical protein